MHRRPVRDGSIFGRKGKTVNFSFSSILLFTFPVKSADGIAEQKKRKGQKGNRPSVLRLLGYADFWRCSKRSPYLPH